MTNFTLGRWLVVALVLVALVVAAPLVGAHGDESIADGAPPYDGTTTDWVAWMEGHMNEHMGGDFDEMGPGMADGAHGHGMAGQGHGC
ncbi:hypothetical protein [Haloarchaeobius sp. DFWS5]|uniref:hypothetical protein n=1 Tax=Haloarchaeobius sp. DFWS5 TaxID=3446114 RepID=UPI003EBD5243